jgi:hypothetical protein
LTVAKSGFKTYSDNIVVQAGERQRVKVHLEADAGQKYVESQLPQAKAGNWWAQFCLWEAYQKGLHDVQPNPAEARRWLAELIKGVHLATFRPVQGFAPRTPEEFLNEFGQHSSLRSGDKRIGGASFFRTRVQDGSLVGSFLTEYPDQMRAAVAANPSLQLVSIEKLTPERFVSYEASPQESLVPGASDAGPAPVVVATEPAANATDVDASRTEIRVTFNKAMRDRSWSWCTSDEGFYPGKIGPGQAGPHYEKDGRTCVLPVALASGKTYALWINSGKYRGFADVAGRPAAPYLLVFSTAGPARPLLSAEVLAAHEAKLPEELRAYRDWTDNNENFREALQVGEIAPEQRAAKEAQWLVELRTLEGRAAIPAINGLAKLRSGKAVPGLLRIAAERREKDNRDRWMATRALGIIGDDSVVPELVHLTYHYNTNARLWAQISLVRLTGQNFGADVAAWQRWWHEQGRRPEIAGERVSWTSRQGLLTDPAEQREQDQQTVQRLRAGASGGAAAGQGSREGPVAAANVIVEGVGLRDVHVGMTRPELLRALGRPDPDSTLDWLKWATRRIECAFHSGSSVVSEVRFDPGFRGGLGNGIVLGSPDQIVKLYGKPQHTVVRESGAREYEYSGRGILFWSNRGRISQIVVFKPYGGEAAAGGSEPAPPAAPGASKKVPFAIGPSQFLPGDKIEIEEVWSANGSLAKGDTVRVKGTYTLASHPTASLAFYITSSGRSKGSEPDTSVTRHVQAGKVAFDMERTLSSEGHMHLGFYDTHSCVGTVYFGTAAQMKEIAHWDLSTRSHRSGGHGGAQAAGTATESSGN